MIRLLACMMLVAAPVFAQDKPEKKDPKKEPEKKQPEKTPGKKDSDPGKKDADEKVDPAKFLTDFANNFKLVKSFTYKVAVTNLIGSETNAEVAYDRADAGGWKFMAKGDTKTSKGQAKGVPFHVSYDGADARSVRENDRQIGELSAPETKEEIRNFFVKERANSPIIWELLEETPFDFASKATLKLESEVEIDEQKCVVIRITIKDDKPETTDVADFKGGIYTFRKKDLTLVKVERFRSTPNPKPTDKPMRTITLSDAKLSETASGTDYAIETPKGYTVRPEPKSINKPKK